MRQHIVFGLGSNMGDREANLRWALQRLMSRLGDLEVAGLYRTQAISDVPQDDYLNTVAIGRHPLPHSTVEQERELLQLLADVKSWEHQAGRRPGPRFGPRPLDVDILLWGELQCRVEGTEGAPAATDGIVLPHPRLAQRRFVLAPLAELRPHWTVPGEAGTVRQLLQALGTSQEVERLPNSSTWHPTLSTADAPANRPPQGQPPNPRRPEIR